VSNESIKQLKVELEHAEKTLACLLGSANYRKAEIAYLKKQIEEAEKPKFNEPWKPKEGGKYWYIDEFGDIKLEQNVNCKLDIDRIAIGNCFDTHGQAGLRAKEIKVYNLLKNFSDANGGDEINFTSKIRKFNIIYDYLPFQYKKIEGTHAINNSKHFMTIYFISQEIEEEAIR